MNLLFASAGDSAANYWALGGWTLLLAGLLFAAGFAVLRLRRWREPASSDLDQQVALYRSLLKKGELSPREYRRILNQLEEQRGDSSSQAP